MTCTCMPKTVACFSADGETPVRPERGIWGDIKGYLRIIE